MVTFWSGWSCSCGKWGGCWRWVNLVRANHALVELPVARTSLATRSALHHLHGLARCLSKSPTPPTTAQTEQNNVLQATRNERSGWEDAVWGVQMWGPQCGGYRCSVGATRQLQRSRFLLFPSSTFNRDSVSTPRQNIAPQPNVRSEVCKKG